MEWRFEFLKAFGFVFIAIFFLFLSFYVGLMAQVSLFAALVVFLGVLNSKFGFLHPLNFYPPFYFMYSITYIFYIYFLGRVDPFLLKIVPVCIVGLIGYSFGVYLFLNKNINIYRFRRIPDFLWKNDFGNNRGMLLWCFFGVLCLLVSLYILTLGLGSKREFLDASEGTYLEHASKFYVVYSLISVCLIVQLNNNLSVIHWKKVATLLVVSFSVLLVGFGVTGERDFIFRFGFFLFAIYFTVYKNYKSWYAVVLIFAMLFLLPIAQSAKGFFLGGAGDIAAAQELTDILNNDFASPSRVFHYLLESDLPKFYGETYIWDIKRFFSPIFSQDSTTAWFHNTLRSRFGDEGVSGWGFSLVGEGFINFGYFGVFFQFLFLGLVTYIIFVKSFSGFFVFLFYLMYVPTLIYVLRADMANYLSLNIKVNLPMVLLIWTFLRKDTANHG